MSKAVNKRQLDDAGNPTVSYTCGVYKAATLNLGDVVTINYDALGISTNFAVKEFACNDGSDAIMVAPRLVMVLQTIRSHFGKAVTINSAYRTPQYNTKVGGVAHSQHCYGTAADISIKGVTPAQIASFAREIMPDWGGVGIYSTFCHVDAREVKTGWNG